MDMEEWLVECMQAAIDSEQDTTKYLVLAGLVQDLRFEGALQDVKCT
jgi:hypothetical protein